LTIISDVFAFAWTFGIVERIAGVDDFEVAGDLPGSRGALASGAYHLTARREDRA
jgi:hypothetical protein